ncbi:MAG TPA: murein biosynthesis integral membrane protein MurJ [Myxococcales bacterium]|nr:murein biosynthesis integral membrane protein MurJ [Myxococcales bacterium]
MSETRAETTATAPAPAAAPAKKQRGGAALLVGAGILLSRLAGLVRQRVLGYYLGTSLAADAYTAALRIPNFLQNLLGEGVLSASFIPVYASLRGKGEDAQARKVAGAVAGLLTLVTGLFALLGVLATPYLLAAIAPGFTGETRELAIRLVRIFFPSISLLVLSAFCIGVLNSHHKFFLSYAAPVVWSAAIVVALVAGAHAGPAGDQARIAVWAAWGAVVGGGLQLGLQLPSVLRLLGRGARLALGRGDANVSEVVRNFGPVVVGKGVNQLSAYVDTFIASWLPAGTVAALSYAQIIYTLPVSLFGMAVSAASLPSMSADAGVEGKLRAQTEAGLRAIAFPVVPSVAAFLALGDVICAALFQTGHFGGRDVNYVWLILAGSTVGLLAATMARLYSSAFYALRDTRTPLNYAVVRVILTAVLGFFCGLALPRLLGVDAKYGAAGLTASAGVAGWIEFALLRRGIAARIGECHLPKGLLPRLWGAAALATGVALGVKYVLPHVHPAIRAVIVLGSFGVTYLAATSAMGVAEAGQMTRRVRRVIGR